MSADRESLSTVAVRGTLWTYSATYGGKLLVFASTLVLARLLDRTDFGLAGYAIVAISFLDLTQDLGVGAAVIFAREEPKSSDTAFWLNLASGVGLFTLTWFVAPWVGVFFDEPRAVELTRALGFSFPITALGNIHSALLRKRLQFRRRFVPDLVRAMGKGLVSIALALAGWGAWSLVLGQLAGTAVGVLAFWWAVPWRPRFQFDARIARSLLGYGWNIVIVDSLAVVLNKIDNVFVGRILGTAALGVYTLAFRIPELLVKQFAQATGQVLFPVYSRMRDDPARLRDAFLSSMRLLSMVTIPVALGLAVLAEPIVRVLLTDKWLDAAPVMALISIQSVLRALTFNIGAVYKAQGRPEILMRLSLIQLPFTVPALWWAAEVGGSVVAVAWMQVALAGVFGALRFSVAAWLLGIRFAEWVRTFAPFAACGAAMVAAVWLALAGLDDSQPWLETFVGVGTGAVAYALCLWLVARPDVLQLSLRLRGALSRV